MIFVILGEVILEAMHVVSLTAWTAFSFGPRLLVIFANGLQVRLLIFLVGILLKVDVLDCELTSLFDLFFGPLDLMRLESVLLFGRSEVAIHVTSVGFTRACCFLLFDIFTF